MKLVLLIAIPLLAGGIAWPLSYLRRTAARWLCLAGSLAQLALALQMWIAAPEVQARWISQFQLPWIPQWGISFHLAMDGLSLLLVVLTAFLGVISVAASWAGITKRVGFFHFNLMWLLGSLAGMFLAVDLFLFYFFWEMMLIPLYLLIGIWGYEKRIYATIKFVIFTQAGSLLMLLAILALYFIHGSLRGQYTFDYEQLLDTPISQAVGMWLMLGFFIAFAVKLPAFPIHTWLPDAHTEAPTAGSIVLAGLVLKAGAYGMLRFMLPLFPQAVQAFAPAAMTLAIIGILYGALMAFAQSDLKRLVAYTSISHMGFVLLGVFAGSTLALQGSVVVILAHGMTTGALFFIVGALGDRIHTRDMGHMGGLWSAAPRMGGVMTFFSLASLGLPGLANFVGEFLVLLGTFQVYPLMAVLAAGGMIVSVIYSLWMLQRVFHGPKAAISARVADFGRREMAISSVLIAGVLWLGIYPQPVLRMAQRGTDILSVRATGVLPVDTAKSGDETSPRRMGETPMPRQTALAIEGGRP